MISIGLIKKLISKFGFGGSAFAYVDVTGSRNTSTVYTNNEDYAIQVQVGVQGGSQTTATAYVNGKQVDNVGVDGSASNNGGGMSFPVPAGTTYQVTRFYIWQELRKV